MKRTASQDRNRIKKRETSRVFLVALIGFGILIVAVLLFLMAFFKRSWSEGSDRNILLIPETINGYKGKILFAHISPTNHKIDVVMLNPELSLPVIGGYGDYPLRSIYPLWTLEKKDEKSLSSVYSFAMGKVIDDVWKSDRNNFDPENLSFKNVTQKLLFFKIASHLTLGDRLWLYRFTQGLRPDEVKVAYVDTLADWQKIQADSPFADQSKNCNFAVVNTISVTGAGTRVGKMLENSGFSIVRITDQDQPISTTELVLGDQAERCRDQQEHTLHAMPLHIKVVQDAARAQEYRANMVLFIGSDLKPFF